MKPPGFWSAPPDRPGAAARLLAPLAALTAWATARRVADGPRMRPGIPVICVGNVNVGGTGKTPTAMYLAQMLAERGHAPHILSRGHGGRLSGPLRVDPRRHGAGDVGDEPLLLSAFAPVWIARDRAAGAAAAEAAGAGVLILDDGFQNPALARDLSIVVADAQYGFGNGRCLPAGPLREPVAAGLKRADLLLTIGDAAAQARFAALWGAAIPATLTHLTGTLEPLRTGMDWHGLRAFAFAGIGRPDKFFATLAGLGADVVAAQALEDHQPLGPALLGRLEMQAARLGAHLVTTEKDAARLPAEARHKVLTLPVRLVPTDAAAFDAALAPLFAKGAAPDLPGEG
jgi:tetraacyldisaccharide 4'-kinase